MSKFTATEFSEFLEELFWHKWAFCAIRHSKKDGYYVEFTYSYDKLHSSDFVISDDNAHLIEGVHRDTPHEVLLLAVDFGARLLEHGRNEYLNSKKYSRKQKTEDK